MFSRDFRRQEGAKFKIYLSFEDYRGFQCGSLFGAVVVSTGCRWSGSLGVILPFVACSLISSAFLLCSRCVACKYGSISRFKGVFSGFWAFCVGLCCLRALCGLCGFCVREWLGGLKACGVFSSFYPFICLSFCLFALVFIIFALVLSLCISSWLCLCCPRLVRFCCFVFVSSFSLSDYTQKRKGAKVLPLFARFV